MTTRNLEDARLNRSIPEQLKLPFSPIDVILDDHTGEVLDIFDREEYAQECMEAAIAKDFPYNPCGYCAIPIETLDVVESLLDDAKAALYVGRTQKAIAIIEKIKEELFEEKTGD